MTLPAALKDRPFSEPTLVESHPDQALLAEIQRLKDFGLDGRIMLLFEGPSMVSISILPEVDPKKKADFDKWFSQMIGQ